MLVRSLCLMCVAKSTKFPFPVLNSVAVSYRCFKKIKGNEDKSHPTSETKTEKDTASGATGASVLPRVLLLEKDETKIGFMSLAEAQTLAKKKDLKLVKLENQESKQTTQIYQLMTGAQLHEERMKIRAAKKTANDNVLVNKGDKTLVVGGKITEHDLLIKTNTIKKWLSKGHHVSVTVNNFSSEDHAIQIFTTLEKAADEVGGQALQKRFSTDGVHNVLKFRLQLSKKKLAQEGCVTDPEC